MLPQHTFVILAYEDSPYLSECIESLKKQTLKSYILISTSTPSKYISELATKYDLPIRINLNSSGLASDWNFGLHQSTTQYVTLAHQDDIYRAQYTQTLLDKLKRNQDNLIAFCDYVEIKSNQIYAHTPNLIIKRILLELNKKSPKSHLLRFGSPIPCPSVMYNLENLTNFTFDEKFTINPDWNAWIQLTQQQGDFVRIKDKLLIHRLHQQSATTRGIKDHRRYQEDIRCLHQLWPNLIAHLIARIYSLSYLGN